MWDSEDRLGVKETVGERIDPCGTPAFTRLVLEKILSTTTWIE